MGLKKRNIISQPNWCGMRYITRTSGAYHREPELRALKVTMGQLEDLFLLVRHVPTIKRFSVSQYFPNKQVPLAKNVFDEIRCKGKYFMQSWCST